MFIAIVSDDTPGFRETFYVGPFEEDTHPRALCAAFNAKRQGNWSAYVSEVDKMPDQLDWKKRVGESMLNNA